MRKSLMLFLMLMLSGVLAFAQSRTISGTVKDESGTPVPYATVTETGTRNATTADANGNFSLKMKGGGSLTFTATGFDGASVNPTGNNVAATLIRNNTELATVTITTAFGVKREKKALGYSSQEVTAKDLNQANQGNALSALSGKVAGLQITNSTGDPGAAAYIRLRGITSLGGGQPLIVVDGVPIDNSTTGTSLGNVSQSNRGVDLNPDDIESVSVLKGPAAASLYGTQGSDGVILITTKRGKKARDGKMFDISYEYGLTIDHVNKLPDLQMQYAKGTGGKLSSFTAGTSTSFGPLNDTLKWTGVANVWDPHGDIVGASNPTGNNVAATLIRNNTELATVTITTAFGVKREKKALGYSSQEVTAKDLNQANQGNALSALSGKVAGLQITNSTGDPGAAAYIRLRGITSLGGGQPLIVVDGVPIDNSTTGTSLGNVSQSNRGVDLNPDDIESVSVLKGPAAASLYGTQGSDGVILITTKRGKKARDGKMFDISYEYGLTIDHVNKLPDLQMQYAKGTGGKLSSFTAGTSTSFGPLNDTLKWTGVANVWDPHGDIVGASNPAGTIKFVPYNNPNQFFRNGKNQSHNIALSGGNDNLTYRFSYSNLFQEGIIPTSNFERNTVRLNADAKLTDKLSTGASMSYIVSGGERVQEGSNTSGILLGLLRTPNSFDNSNGATSATDPAAYLLPSGFQRTYRGIGDPSRGYYDNPYWTINKNKFRDRVNRIIGNVYLTYAFTPWLSVTDRIGLDQYTDARKQNYAITSATAKAGSVIYNDYVYQNVNNNLIATLTHKIVNNLNGSLLLGSEYYSERYHHENATGSTLIIPDFYDLSNSSNQTAYSTSYNSRTKACYQAFVHAPVYCHIP